jgi:hypothetical protein
MLFDTWTSGAGARMNGRNSRCGSTTTTSTPRTTAGFGTHTLPMRGLDGSGAVHKVLPRGAFLVIMESPRGAPYIHFRTSIFGQQQRSILREQPMGSNPNYTAGSLHATTLQDTKRSVFLLFLHYSKYGIRTKLTDLWGN